jgi:hypothetical protein
MFCVAAAPTPAFTHGQRLATQMLEVVMATPTMPVRSQKPEIEKVIAYSLVSLRFTADRPPPS